MNKSDISIAISKVSNDKLIFLKKGYRSSLQSHTKKHETIYILSGSLRADVSVGVFKSRGGGLLIWADVGWRARVVTARGCGCDIVATLAQEHEY